MRTGTFVDPPQDTGPTGSGTNARMKNIVDCMQWLSYVLHHSCLCVVWRPLWGRTRRPLPLNTTISVHTSIKVCTVYVYALKYVYTGNSVVFDTVLATSLQS